MRTLTPAAKAQLQRQWQRCTAAQGCTCGARRGHPPRSADAGCEKACGIARLMRRDGGRRGTSTSSGPTPSLPSSSPRSTPTPPPSPAPASSTAAPCGRRRLFSCRAVGRAVCRPAADSEPRGTTRVGAANRGCAGRPGARAGPRDLAHVRPHRQLRSVHRTAHPSSTAPCLIRTAPRPDATLCMPLPPSRAGHATA
jgi:hypothetical protein